VGRLEKAIADILRGTADKNLAFVDLCYVLEALGFRRRIRGDHHIFTKSGIEEIINIQPRGREAKPYQVKQVRNLIVKYRLEAPDGKE
jgi:hypothetical protein